MADKNKDESVCDANPHIAHVIAVAMGNNNCPTTEWRSWKDVPRNVKKFTMDELLLMDDTLEGGYNWWRYEVLRNGPGP
ncbi:hypothetical protein D8674_012064 [Pyrus ussuriensis x Pyrus communis]|uniref:Uncharacterized protein n=1 Tax=Pyrus ussuriensis x Pyrus communis TaxID=2448454 RepID=A0A5N5G0J4_9ROSA|nr:hypothetical protein D8674_012064 [Pyrus ussuriensis x Pyrus communis]